MGLALQQIFWRVFFLFACFLVIARAQNKGTFQTRQVVLS